MEVSFQGFKNAGAVERINKSCIIFNTELTNDLCGNDLNNFEKIFQKSANRYNKNFLNFIVECSENKNRSRNSEYKFYVNDVEYKADESNLELFGKIARLFKKIINTDENAFRVDKDYLDSEDMTNNLKLGRNNGNDQLIASIHSVKSVKRAANDLLTIITKAIENALS